MLIISFWILMIKTLMGISTWGPVMLVWLFSRLSTFLISPSAGDNLTAMIIIRVRKNSKTYNHRFIRTFYCLAYLARIAEKNRDANIQNLMRVSINPELDWLLKAEGILANNWRLVNPLSSIWYASFSSWFINHKAVSASQSWH